MRVRYIFAALSLAASTPSMGQESASPSPDKAPVNVLGIAELVFDSAPENYEHWERFKGSWGMDFALEFERAGPPAACGPAEPDISDEQIEILCNDLLEHARLKLPEGYTLGGRRALVGMRKEPSITLPGFGEEGSSPFAFKQAAFDPSQFVEYEPILPTEQPIRPPDNAAFTSIARDLEYPIAALERRIEGLSEVLVGFNADGALETCRPTKSSGSAVLDNAACVHILSFRGQKLAKPVASEEPRYYSKASFRWVIPGK